ncbi:MAG: GNAT family N-acyltransferase [Bacteroidota bacterium]
MQEPQIDQFLQDHKIGVEITDYDLKNIPKEGPFLIFTNRKFQGIDEFIWLQTFGKKEFNLRFFAPSTPEIPQLLSPYYVAQALHGQDLSRLTVPRLHETMAEQINAGYVLVVFMDHPEKEQNPRQQTLSRRCIRAALKLELPMLPVNLEYDNPYPLLNEIIDPNRAPSIINWPVNVVVRIGASIAVTDQQAFKLKERFRKFLRSKIYALGSTLEVKKFFFMQQVETTLHQDLTPPVEPERLEHDIQNLTYGHLIASQSNYDVLLAKAQEIPNAIQEIGRLRELTFRGVGEGTGRGLDLDEFDLYYEQLFIWDRVEKKIVGGYRIGKGDEIFRRFGVEGFYIHSLFEIKKGFFPIMQQAVELGRSYIVPEYQKKRLPLFLLWKGILHFLLQNPRYRYLYGPLSISKHYSDVAKSIIVEFVKRHYFNNQLARYLKPRTPFEFKPDNIDLNAVMVNLGNEISRLDSLIEDIEPAHFKIPVLLKQYIKQNAKFISFNVDPNFSDVLDGFMILDLKEVPMSTIEALKKESGK